MSATTTTQQTKTERVAEYLREEVSKANGSLYVKSRFIAEEIELSAKEIGATIHRIDPGQHGIDVEKWAYTSGTTWRVSSVE